MALIPCPDCGRDVSDSAPTCPQCGRPIANHRVAVDAIGEPLVSVQATAKRLKVHRVLSNATMILGILFVLSFPIYLNPGLEFIGFIGVAFCAIGLVWGLLTRLAVWWQHG